MKRPVKRIPPSNKTTKPHSPGPLLSKRMPDHQRRLAFVGHYMVHFCAGRAAREAGYAKHSADNTGYDLLRTPEVRAEIDRRRAAMAENLEKISKERIEYELLSIGLANMADFGPMFGDGPVSEKLLNLTREQAAAVHEIVVEEFRDGRSDHRTVRRTKFKLADKKGALELLGKFRGLIVDKVDHRHEHQGLILHTMMKEIWEQNAGKPIVEIEPE